MFDKKILLFNLFIVSLLTPVFCHASEKAEPSVGEPLPPAKIETLSGESADWRELLKGKRAVIVFYRGGWCPYCTQQLKELQGYYAELKALDTELVALCPDLPIHLRKTIKKQGISFPVYSDSAMSAADAMGLSFILDLETRKKYKGYGIDLEVASGKNHFKLPHPAAYIVDETGKILFKYVNEDYTIRIESEVLVEKVLELFAAE